ncbi:MAG TPA: SDR family NAD(P)-dependent oxidoreductase [Polyangiaceae bacterium]|nr:SDR family NAD(P)-dependent oxidoreductase [Polyangiaceae bacterium]
MRLSNKVALVVGAGQTPGDTIGNGRATAILFAREGARVLAVDRNEASAEETAELVRKEGGTCRVVRADVTKEADVKSMVERCVAEFGRIDVLHNNVGVGTGDNGVDVLSEEAWDGIYAVNAKSVFFACKHAIPVMREQRSGVILNVSSIASICATPISAHLTAYKSSKAAVNAMTQGLAIANASYGIRVNAILPGLMNTPMAIESLASRLQVDKGTLVAARDKMVPLGEKMGTAWDVAYAALFLASDEAKFITGALLPVDGGQSARTG